MEKSTLREEYEQQQEDALDQQLLSPAFMKKRLISYSIRTAIALAIIIMFWEYRWIGWALYIYIPLNVLSLFSIIATPYLVRLKLKRAAGKMELAKNVVSVLSEENE